ncbi:hypothetical protein BMS3Abin09_00193 [bacterium BMS3Abin09]|nr:hypothetical protein BMS3Abin09_00193 [bacterium BMS3Abin09]
MFSILNENVCPISLSVFCGALRSICEPGRKAGTPPTSTVSPPFTLPMIFPSTVSSALKASSSLLQVFTPSAFCLESFTKPSESLSLSIKTSITSPGFILPCSSPTIFLLGMNPSDLAPTSTMTPSGFTCRTVPCTISPDFNPLKVSA